MKRPKSILPLLSPRLKSWVGVPSKGGYDKCSILPAPRGPGGAQNRATPTPNESNLAERSAGSDPSCVTSSLTLLIADHRGDGLEQRLETLGHGRYRVLVTHDLRATLRAIEKELPSVIVVDTLSKTGAEELRALDAVRAGDPPIPLLWLSGNQKGGDLSLALDAVQNEVWDMTDREASTEEVSMRIDRLLLDAKRVGEIIDLRHRAQHDDRTDLLRAKAFEARLVEHVSASQRHNLEMALVLIDLDKFGLINKEHDHTVGDILIAQAGEIIRRTLRTEDVAGRIGGDEFAVVLPYTHKVDAARVVGRLVEEIQKLSGRPRGAKDDIAVSASIGFETFNGRDLPSVEVLRNHAERALRAAKLAGGNQGVYFRQLASEEVTNADS
jgi:diguanylate cyclase (GGDEF)-like protein